VALCGFFGQSIAEITATFAAVLHDNLTWACAATTLSALHTC
jgi:DHA1 family bicyclomycin/chloramphenicol resistance-like MFS transporter